jgi:aminopeptidase
MTIKRSMLNKWADIILGHSLRGINSKDMVMIKGEAAAWPLISVLQEKILKSGGMADIFLVPPDNERGRVWGAAVARLGDISRLKAIPGWQRQRYEAFTKYIEILGMERPELTQGAIGPLMKRIVSLDDELLKIRLKKPWVITMYPTPAFAKIERLAFPEYTKLLLKGSTQSPRSMAGIAERLAARLRDTRQLKVVTRDPGSGRLYELRLSLAKSIILKDTETVYSSVPCGEVFTSPDASSVEGEVYLDMPISMQGDVIQGARLKFAAGKIVSFSARKGLAKLAYIINTDKGSRGLGETAFGINPGLPRPLMHPLFCEKLSGTMHFAIGKCLSTCFVRNPSSKKGAAMFRDLVRSGVANISAQHVDLVVSFRKGGAGKAVYLDGKELKMKNGNWAP